MTQTSAPSTSPATLADQATRETPATREDPFTLLFADLDGELKTARRFLERVPNGKDDWRPHKKSMSLGDLATHVAQLPGFGILMLTRDEYDGTAGMPRTKVADNAERLKVFDGVSGELRGLLEGLTWDYAMSPWKLEIAGRVVVNAPRVKLVRSMVISHLAHHRAQLGVYLRLLDIPIPGSYGASADEGPPQR